MTKRNRETATNNIPPGINHISTTHKFYSTDEVDPSRQKRKKLSDERHDTLNLNAVVQIIVGTYEKILHGVTATITLQENSKHILSVEFADSFLFSAHGSAIRCLAISPQSTSVNASRSQKAILASGSSDQVINLYHISKTPAALDRATSSRQSSSGAQTTENPRNRELGSLQHHSSSINALFFPTRSKLLSAADDNTIAITRTRDWTVLSTIKAPIPKALGRPSGDTAPTGGTPTGINDFAIHPSMKLMVTVGKGEKCMRLWNLVTGKKAGVLNFEKDLLQGIGEGKWSSGEGRKVQWNALGEEFVVGFERGAVVFGMDSKPRCRILPVPRTKMHQLRYIEVSNDIEQGSEILAVSTEEGYILFYDTKVGNTDEAPESKRTPILPTLNALANVGGIPDGVKSRIKDFEALRLKVPGIAKENLLLIAGSSDGVIHLWIIDDTEMFKSRLTSNKTSDNSINDIMPQKVLTRQTWGCIGKYETGNRITCLKAFVMSGSIDAGNARSQNNI